MRTSYQLKQSQYARIYQASERTVRNWMKKGAPLDDPREMVESFLQAQRTTAPAQKFAEHEEVRARYRQEIDPATEAAEIRDALGERIADLEGMLGLARDFARKYEPTNWQQIIERCHVITGEIARLYDLAGIGDDYECLEQTRADLAKPVIWNWAEDREGTGQAKA